MKKVILMGAGCSILEGEEKGLYDKIKGEEIWSLNYAFLTLPYPPSRELFVDIPFFKNNAHELQVLNDNKKVPIYARKHNYFAFMKELNQVQCTKEKGGDGLYIGRLGFVGLFGISLALYENYDKIYLLGYDFGVPPNKTDKKATHYYQNRLKVKSSGMGNTGVYYKQGRLKKEVEDFEYYLPHKDKIVNVSLITNIPYFKKISYDEFFEELKNESI